MFVRGWRKGAGAGLASIVPREFEALHLHHYQNFALLRKTRGNEVVMNATFFKRVPLPREQRRALRKRLHVLIAQTAWLEARVNWRADPRVRKILDPIQTEIAVLEAQL